MKWEMIPAEEYCDSVRDGTHDTPKPTDHGYKLVTGKHIKNGCIDPTDAYYISHDDYTKINERSLVEQWDVLMSMIGTVGEVAVVKNTPDYAIKNVALFKCGHSELKGKWLGYYLQTPMAKGHMSGNQKGSSQQFLSLKQLRELPVPVAEEQYMQKIVDYLSAYDDLIENNQKQIKLLEEAAQRLYKEWFIDLHFPGHENTPIHDGLPEEWERKTAEDFFEISIGKTPPRTEKQCFVIGTEGIPWVSISDMGNSGVFVFDTVEALTKEAVEKYNIKVIPQGTILLSFKLTVGRVSITTQDMCSNEAIAHFRTDDTHRSYTFFYLKAFEYDKLGNTSSISKAVNSKIIKAMPFVMPDEKTLETFSRITSPLLNDIYTKQAQNKQLIQARDRLLPQLMSGELKL